jgi:hypothetical protein
MSNLKQLENNDLHKFYILKKMDLYIIIEVALFPFIEMNLIVTVNPILLIFK